MKRPNPNFDTRKHSSDGIRWHGYLYESIPQLGFEQRVMIVEDHGDYLIVANYCHPCGWHETCKPTGVMYQSNRIGVGKPTIERIERLKNAVRELQA